MQEAIKMRLKGYGNAICTQIGSVFISAFMDYLKESKFPEFPGNSI